MIPFHVETAEEPSVLANVLAMPTAHAKIMQESRKHFLLQWRKSVYVMARPKLHVSVTVAVVPLAHTGTATKLGVSTSTLARMTMPELTSESDHPLTSTKSFT